MAAQMVQNAADFTEGTYHTQQNTNNKDQKSIEEVSEDSRKRQKYMSKE